MIARGQKGCHKIFSPCIVHAVGEMFISYEECIPLDQHMDFEVTQFTSCSLLFVHKHPAVYLIEVCDRCICVKHCTVYITLRNSCYKISKKKKKKRTPNLTARVVLTQVICR